MSAVRETSYDYPKLFSGKVRDVYQYDDSYLLIATSDRVSAMDNILDAGIPDKGKVLNQMTLFWMNMVDDIIRNHIVKEFDSRSVIVKQAKPLPVECIVRGYITGSGWNDYKKTGKVCGYLLPENLVESERLATPLFTPSTKAQAGQHDENISIDQMSDLIGYELASEIADKSIRIYERASNYARKCGIIIADTKFEFGLINGKLHLIDEVLTPDSSRFWDLNDYQPGRPQKSFDKQPLRDWAKENPDVKVPEHIVNETAERYRKAFEILTKQKLQM